MVDKHLFYLNNKNIDFCFLLITPFSILFKKIEILIYLYKSDKKYNPVSTLSLSTATPYG